MKNVATIIRLLAGDLGREGLVARPIRIDHPDAGQMRLCIERIGLGPREGPLISVAHYYDKNGDAIADPEMTIELPSVGWETGKDWIPVSFEMPAMGIKWVCVWREETEHGLETMVDANRLWEQRDFMKKWNRNIGGQGYVAVARQMAREKAREAKRRSR